MTVFHEQENGSLEVQNVEGIKSDLRIIINQLVQAVAEEAALGFRQDQRQELINFGQQRSESMKIVNVKADSAVRLDHHSERCGVPSSSCMVVCPDKDGQDKLTPGSWPPELEEHLQKGICILREGCYPQDALNEFNECWEVLKMATATPPFFSLELEMNSALALTYLGRYGDANSELIGVLQQISVLQEKKLLDATRESLLSSIAQETSFGYACCLIRMGRYSLARRELLALTTIFEEYFHMSNHHSIQYDLNQCILQVNVYCMRDLVEAHLGSFGTLQLHPARSLNRLKTLMEEKSEDSVEMQLYQSWELTVKVTLAKTAMLQGDYKAARADLRAATKELQKSFGRQYLTRLEALLCYARSLVYTCDHEEAMCVCDEVKQVVKQVAEKDCDITHPLCLEADHIQALAYRSQGSLEDALNDSQSLLETVTGIESYRSTHPLFLECATQIWSLHIYQGNYCSAEERLEGVWENLLQRVSELNESYSITPAGVACLSELAWARCRLGKHKAAKRTISECLHRQLKFYWPQLGLEDEWDGSSAKDCMYRSGLVHALQAKIKSEKQATKVTRHNQQLHPDLLFTLSIMSRIEIQEELPDWDFIEKMNSIVLSGFELRLNDGNGGNEDHEWTMRARLAIGHAQLAQGRASHDESSRAEAQRKAHKTYKSAVSRFVPGSERAESHPLALHARRESIMLSIVTRPEASETELRAKRERLRETIALPWRYLGGESPETQRSLFYLLSLDVILDEEWASETKDKLLALLERPNVLEQRFVETLSLHEQVVQLYCDFEQYDTCQDVTNRMRTIVDTSSIPSNDEMHDAAMAIVKRAELLLQSQSDDAEESEREDRLVINGIEEFERREREEGWVKVSFSGAKAPTERGMRCETM